VPAQDAADESTSLSDVDEMLRLIGDAEKAAAAEVAADEPLDDKTAFDNQRSAAPQTATLPATDNPNAADAAVAARTDAHAAQSNDDVEAAELTKSMPEAPRQIRSFRHSSDGESAALRVDSSRAQAHALSIDRNTMHAKSDRMDRSASTVDAANPIAGMSIGTSALASNADHKSNRDSSGFGGFSSLLQSSVVNNASTSATNTTQQPSFAETLRPMEATPFIATPVGHAGWAGEVSKAVIRLVDRDLAEAKLSLNPEHLGPLDVSLDLSGSSIAVSFVAASPEAKQALEQSLPQLARMMSEAGISLGQTSVNQQDRHAHEQRADGQSNPSNKSISRVSQSRDQRHESAPAASLNGFRPLTVRPGGVDLYA
jgi:flagellar hook-length control protein FliK